MRKRALCGMLLAAALPVMGQTVQVNKENRTIEVTATDSAKAFADVATLTVGFKVYAPDTQAAYDQGTTLSNAIVKALTDAGVDKKAIQSQDQAVRETPYNPSDKEWREQHRYTVTQSWTVKTNADAVGKLLDVAVRAGANESGHIDWSLADDNALQAKAAAKAMERAKAIAANMAAGLGAKLGPLVYASNEEPMQGYAMGYAAGMGRGVYQVHEEATPLAINNKEMEKTATVRAIFAIE